MSSSLVYKSTYQFVGTVFSPFQKCPTLLKEPKMLDNNQCEICHSDVQSDQEVKSAQQYPKGPTLLNLKAKGQGITLKDKVPKIAQNSQVIHKACLSSKIHSYLVPNFIKCNEYLLSNNIPFSLSVGYAIAKSFFERCVAIETCYSREGIRIYTSPYR